MTARPLAYIVAPFGADTVEGMEHNTRVAAVLCRVAVERGYAPICVHPAILAGCYGDDNDPDDRARGLEIDVAILEAVRRSGGSLFVLQREDGTLSAGSRIEVRAWLDGAKLDLEQPGNIRGDYVHASALRITFWRVAPLLVEVNDGEVVIQGSIVHVAQAVSPFAPAGVRPTGAITCSRARSALSRSSRTCTTTRRLSRC